MTSLQIKCFLEAAKYLNFSESARRLYMSQATFSRNIAMLESELGVALFSRTNKVVALTPEGQAALNGMKKLESTFDEILKDVTDISKGIKGSLSLSVLEGQMLEPVMQTTIMRFEKRYPGIELTLSRESFKALTGKLNSGELDIAATLAFDVQLRPELNWKSICKLPTLMVLPAGHRLAQKQGLKLIDFKNEVFIIPSEDECSYCNISVTEGCRHFGFEPNILQAPDIKTQILWLEAGRGISASNPNHMMCNSPALTEVSVSELMTYDFVLAWHSYNTNPAVRCFLDVFEEVRESFGLDEQAEPPASIKNVI